VQLLFVCTYGERKRGRVGQNHTYTSSVTYQSFMRYCTVNYAVLCGLRVRL